MEHSERREHEPIEAEEAEATRRLNDSTRTPAASAAERREQLLDAFRGRHHPDTIGHFDDKLFDPSELDALAEQLDRGGPSDPAADEFAGRGPDLKDLSLEGSLDGEQPASPLGERGLGLEDLLAGDPGPDAGAGRFDHIDDPLGVDFDGPPRAGNVDDMAGELSRGSEFLKDDPSGLQAPGLVDGRLVSSSEPTAGTLDFENALDLQWLGTGSDDGQPAYGRALQDEAAAGPQSNYSKLQDIAGKQAESEELTDEEKRYLEEMAERTADASSGDACPNCGVTGGGHNSDCESPCAGCGERYGFHREGCGEAADDNRNPECRWCNQSGRHAADCPTNENDDTCPDCGGEDGSHTANCAYADNDNDDEEAAAATQSTTVGPDGVDPLLDPLTLPRQLSAEETWRLIQAQNETISQPGSADDVQAQLSFDEARRLQEAAAFGPDPRRILTTGDETSIPLPQDGEPPEIDDGFTDPPEMVDPIGGEESEPGEIA
jgi:hypothetical protein